MTTATTNECYVRWSCNFTKINYKSPEKSTCSIQGKDLRISYPFLEGKKNCTFARICCLLPRKVCAENVREINSSCIYYIVDIFMNVLNDVEP